MGKTCISCLTAAKEKPVQIEPAVGKPSIIPGMRTDLKISQSLNKFQFKDHNQAAEANASKVDSTNKKLSSSHKSSKPDLITQRSKRESNSYDSFFGAKTQSKVELKTSNPE